MIGCHTCRRSPPAWSSSACGPSPHSSAINAPSGLCRVVVWNIARPTVLPCSLRVGDGQHRCKQLGPEPLLLWAARFARPIHAGAAPKLVSEQRVEREALVHQRDNESGLVERRASLARLLCGIDALAVNHVDGVVEKSGA